MDGAADVGFKLSDGARVGALVVVGSAVGNNVGVDVLGRPVGNDVGVLDGCLLGCPKG